MRYSTLLVIIFSLVAGCNLGHDHSGCLRQDDDNLIDPFELLKKSNCFRVGGVGRAGVTAPEGIALLKLMNQEESSVVLEKLFHQGSLAGQLYALLGLRFVDRAKYEELLPKLKHRYYEIDTQGGCIIRTETVDDIVKSIESGNLDMYIQRELQLKGL